METQKKIDFLKNHFRYYTLSSWNLGHSYAVNVKLHNLNIPQELQDIAYDAISGESIFWNFEEFLYNFKIAHPGYSIGFNGRCDGYMVLYQDGTMKGVDQDVDWDSDDIEDADVDYSYKLVQDFDQTVELCRIAFIEELKRRANKKPNDYKKLLHCFIDLEQSFVDEYDAEIDDDDLRISILRNLNSIKKLLENKIIDK
jgi:hypothetical protein